MSATSEDRTVHGVLSDGGEVVRYNRAGKWYLELPGRQRQPLSVRQAAQFIIDDRGSRWYKDRQGGTRFDGLVIQRRSSCTATR